MGGAAGLFAATPIPEAAERPAPPLFGPARGWCGYAVGTHVRAHARTYATAVWRGGAARREGPVGGGGFGMRVNGELDPGTGCDVTHDKVLRRQIREAEAEANATSWS
eukprot:gene18068-21112_t